MAGYDYRCAITVDFRPLLTKATPDINSAGNTLTLTYYQLRTSRQLMSIFLEIKAYEKTGKSIEAFKTINQRTDQATQGTSFSPLYQANEKGLISLLAAYSKAVDEAKYTQALMAGTTDRGNFADIENKIPTAVFNSSLALRDAVVAEQGLKVASFYDSRMSDYNSTSINAQKFRLALAMRADVASLMLEQVNAPKAKEIREAAAVLAVLGGTTAYQLAEIWSKVEMDSLIAILEFYTK